MSVVYNTSVVTNGLVLYLDAANTKSYPTSYSAGSELITDANLLTQGDGLTRTCFRDSTTNNPISLSSSIVSGKKYIMVFNVTRNASSPSVSSTIRLNNSSGNITPVVGIAAPQTGTFTTSFTASVGGSLSISGDNIGVDLDVDYVSLKELTSDRYIGNTWYDLSGGNNNATLRNYPTFFNNSLSFNGLNQYAEISGSLTGSILGWTPNGSVGTTATTIEMWFKITDALGTLYSKPWNGLGGYNFLVETFRWTIASINYNYGNIVRQNYAVTLSDGVVHQLVIWVDSTNMGYYIDGAKYSATVAHNIISDTNPSGTNSNVPAAIGTTYPYGEGWSGSSDQAIQGEFYNFKLYNRVLPASEVAQNFYALRGRYGI